MRSRALTALAVSSGIAGIIGCRVIDGTGTLDDSLGVIVSAPVRPGAATAAAPGRASAVATGLQVVYVSLPPGSVPTGVLVTISDQATGLSITTAVANGGFDPVPIAASVGDTLTVEITGSGAPVRAQVVVAAARPLKIVRTSPPSGGRDVPLNAIIVVVFGDPIDPATLTTGSVQLLRDTTPVAGTVQFADSTHLRVAFQPAALLAHTSYQLVVTQAIQDVNGVALDSSVAVSFTTSSGFTALLALYGGLNQTVEPGGSFQLHAVERDAAGNVVLNVPVTYVLLHPATDVTTSVTPDGLVTGLALGTDTIVASTAGGLSGRVAVAVVPTGGIPFLGMWDVVQNVGGTCYSGSFLIRRLGNVPWVQSNLDPGCAAPIGRVGPSGLAFSTALGQMDTVTLFSTQSYGGNPGCDWSGEYVATPEPHIAGSVVNEDTVSNSWHVLICGLGSGTWVATPPMPVAAITATPQQVACAVGTTSFASVYMQNALGNRVGRYPLQVTSDNPGVAGQDTNWVSNEGAIAVAGTLAVLCKAVGQTQLHVTQDLATATITVTVTP